MPRTDGATKAKVLAAATELLSTEGIAGISTRRVANRAGVNQALIHYHYGSIENLMLEVLTGITTEFLARITSQYETDDDFVTQWKTDMSRTLNEDAERGWPKIWLEVLALVINDELLRERYMAEMLAPTLDVIRKGVREAMPPQDRGKQAKVEGFVALISAFRTGMLVNRLLGAERGEMEAIRMLSELFRAELCTENRTGAVIERGRSTSARRVRQN